MSLELTTFELEQELKQTFLKYDVFSEFSTNASKTELFKQVSSLSKRALYTLTKNINDDTHFSQLISKQFNCNAIPSFYFIIRSQLLKKDVATLYKVHPSQVTRLFNKDEGEIKEHIRRSWLTHLLTKKDREQQVLEEIKTSLKAKRIYALDIRVCVDSLLLLYPGYNFEFFNQKIFFKNLTDLIEQYRRFYKCDRSAKKLYNSFSSKASRLSCENSYIDKILEEPTIVIWLLGIVDLRKYRKICLDMSVSTKLSDTYQKQGVRSLLGFSKILNKCVEYAIKSGDETIIDILDQDNKLPSPIIRSIYSYFQRHKLSSEFAIAYEQITIKIENLLLGIDERASILDTETLGVTKSQYEERYGLTHTEVIEVLKNKKLQPYTPLKKINERVISNRQKLTNQKISVIAGIGISAVTDRKRQLRKENNGAKLEKIFGAEGYLTRPARAMTKINNASSQRGVFYVVRLYYTCDKTGNTIELIKFGFTSGSTEHRISQIIRKYKKKLRRENDWLIHEIIDDEKSVPATKRTEYHILECIKEQLSPFFPPKHESYSEIFLAEQVYSMFPEFVHANCLNQIYNNVKKAESKV